MATKTVKKTAPKTAVKPAVKKAPAKKAVAKKTVKTTKQEPVIATPVVPVHECGCGCNHGCGCGGHCMCRGGSKFGRFVKKLIVALIIFALGFAAAKMCCGGKYGMRGPRMQFVNGCLDVSSVKCPKMLEALPAMDINQDGCITNEEFKMVKQQMRREIREMPVEVVDAE